MLKFWYETIIASNQKCLLGCILFSFHGERKPEGTTHKTLGVYLYIYFSLVGNLLFNEMSLILGFLVPCPPSISTTEDLPYELHNDSQLECKAVSLVSQNLAS